MLHYDIVVVGGGPAGLAAAVEARKNGIDRVVILEREHHLGGILLQCIHNGFGLHFFGEELTGPEYADRFVKQVDELGIEYKLDTMVIDISSDKRIIAINSTDGLMEISAGSIVLAMGCRERTRGALNIPGSRPAGIFTAGTAQKYVNLEGYLPGKKIVILGSGDIGLIMARRMTLEGAEVKLVCEIMPYSSGLNRNIVQCLEDFHIPLKFKHTITKIHGNERLEGVTVAAVDENRKPVPGTEEFYECDTLLLSVGLIPENELTRNAGIEISPITGGPMVNDCMQTSVEGIFACGNVVHVHDLVDFVTAEGQRAGNHAVSYIKGQEKTMERITVLPGNGVRYCIPNFIQKRDRNDDLMLFFRSTDVYRNASIVVYDGNKKLIARKKQVITPGEMQSIKLNKDEAGNIEQCLTIGIEE